MSFHWGHLRIRQVSSINPRTNSAPRPGRGALAARGIGDKKAAAAALEVVQSGDLAGHLEVILVDGIVPAFDVAP
jgi:hypothetical protein